MGRELFMFTDAFDAAATISIDVSRAIGKNTNSDFTYSKQDFDVNNNNVKTKIPTKRSLAIDILAAREAYQKI